MMAEPIKMPFVGLTHVDLENSISRSRSPTGRATSEGERAST